MWNSERSLTTTIYETVSIYQTCRFVQQREGLLTVDYGVDERSILIAFHERGSAIE